MSKKNRNLRPSPRPVHSQASTRPAATGEAALDNRRIPSPATVVQEQVDVQRADRDRYKPQDGNVTATDAFPGEATDLVSGDDATMDDVTDTELETIEAAEREEAEAELVEFQGFDNPENRAVQAPTIIDLDAERRRVADDTPVPVIPRRTVLRTYINGEWFNFIKGQEQFVPESVRVHLAEKGVI